MLSKLLPVNIQLERSLVFLCIILLPFKHIFSNIPIILLILVSLIRYYRNFSRIKEQKTLLPLVTFFILYLLGLLYTPDLSLEWKAVEKKLTFLLIPIVIALLPVEKVDQIKSGLWEGIFFLALALGLYSFFSAYSLYNELGYLPTDGERVIEITFMHRPYFALVQVLSFAYVLSLLYERRLSVHPLYIVGLIVSLASIFLIVARLSMVVAMFTSLYFAYAYLRRQKLLNLKAISGILVVLLTVGVVISQYNRLSERSYYMLQGKGEPRILIWRCSYEQLSAPNFKFILGYRNTVSTSQNLVECYRNEYENKTYWSWIYEFNKSFNTHNEFVNITLSYGIIGLLLFLFIFVLIYLKARKEDNILGKFLVFIFLLGCITENLFDRQASVFIFIISAATILYNREQAHKL